MLTGDLPAPETVLPAPGKASLLTARLRPDRLSAEQTERVVRSFGALLGTGAATEFLATLLRETREVTLDLEAEPASRRLVVQLAVFPRAGTRLADRARDLGTAGSAFAPLADGALVGVACRLPLGGDFRLPAPEQLVGKLEQFVEPGSGR